MINNVLATKHNDSPDNSNHCALRIDFTRESIYVAFVDI